VPTFVLLTRLPPDVPWTPEALEAVRREAMRRLQDDGAEVEWINDCVVFGPYDHLDVFHLANVETATRPPRWFWSTAESPVSSQADLAADASFGCGS